MNSNEGQVSGAGRATQRTKEKERNSSITGRLFVLWHLFSLIFIFPHSYSSVTSGSLLFPVHRSLIKASNEEVMHNFICSSSTSGTFSYFTKIYDGFLLKGHNSPPVAGVGVTDAKWAIYRFLVEGEYCAEWFQASHSGHLTPRGLICFRWSV